MTTEEIPAVGRLAGIDFGEARVGVAICDPERRIVSPLATWRRTGGPRDAQFFADLVREEQVVGFVVGLPVYPSGDESPVSRQARRFASWLADATSLPVALHDERFSTSEARQMLQAAGGSGKKKKQKLDQIAAQVILQSWLEARH